MARSILDQLGKQQVPDRPPGFQLHVHERLNIRLLVAHVVEFAVLVLPLASIHFLSSLGGAVFFSITGHYPERGDIDAERNDQDR